MATRVTVIGFDGSALSPAAEKALSQATLIAGGHRHLAAVSHYLPAVDAKHAGASGQPAMVEMGPLAPAIERIARHAGEVAVVASGDPGFFGIVRALRQAGLDPLVLPAVSSVSMAFARAAIPWDDAIVVSAHGRDLRRAVNVCRAHPKVAVLTAPGSGPAELQAALSGWNRNLIVAENLGTPEERVSSDATGARDPNVVLVLDPSHITAPQPGWVAGFAPGSQGFARPESAYAHRGSMITKAEVRAFVLARLSPRLGDLVWDIGTGSGSVAIECAQFGAAVIAIDRDTTYAAQNAEGSGVRVIAGVAPDCLRELPDPDAVFVGGGGIEALKAVTERQPSRVVMALAAIDRVAPAMSTLRQAGYQTEGVQLQANRLSLLPDGSHRLAATNPVFVITGESS